VQTLKGRKGHKQVELELRMQDLRKMMTML
jgi:hypothetical protein